MSSRAAQVYEELGSSLEEADVALDPPMDTFGPLYAANGYAANGYLLKERPDDLTWYGREWLERGSRVTGADYAWALGRMDRIRARFASLFEDYDLLLSPTMAVPAFPVGQFPERIAGTKVDPFWGYTPFTYPVNMAGHPAASVPCGFTSDGLSVGLHIVGRWGDEETVIAASAASERSRPWAHMRPPVS